MASSNFAPACASTPSRRSKARRVWGPIPPGTRVPSRFLPVNPAVNSTRAGLTLTPGMKPRPFSTGRSARISRRSIVSSSLTWRCSLPRWRRAGRRPARSRVLAAALTGEQRTPGERILLQRAQDVNEGADSARTVRRPSRVRSSYRRSPRPERGSARGCAERLEQRVELLGILRPLFLRPAHLPRDAVAGALHEFDVDQAQRVERGPEAGDVRPDEAVSGDGFLVLVQSHRRVEGAHHTARDLSQLVHTIPFRLVVERAEEVLPGVVSPRARLRHEAEHRAPVFADPIVSFRLGQPGGVDVQQALDDLVAKAESHPDVRG